MSGSIWARPMSRVNVVWTLAILASSLLTAISAVPAEAKTPGKTYCFNGVCHRVKTIQEMVALVGRDQNMAASHYDDCRRDRFNPCGLTSSGEAFRPNDADNAASPIYPNGTILLLRNPDTGLAAVVRVNNAGPYWGKRLLDVSRATAEKLGFARRGVKNLEVRVVAAPTLAETRYKKNRRYAAVPGPIGQFASLDRAQGGMMVAMALNAMSGSVFAPTAGKLLPALKTAKPALASVLRSGGDKVASSEATAAELADLTRGMSPAEGLKATARRLYGGDRGSPRAVPGSLMADAIKLMKITSAEEAPRRARRKRAL